MVHLRLVAAIAIMLLAFGFTSPSKADSVALVSIDPASSSVSVGGTFTLDVNISNVTDLYGFQFDLSLAPAVLSAVSITEGSFLAGGGATFFLPGTIDDTAGTIAFTANTLLGPGPGVGDSGTLAVLTLTGLSTGTSGVDLSNVLLLDSNLNPIAYALQDGSIKVASAVAPTSEPNSLALLVAGAGILIFFRRRYSIQGTPRNEFGNAMLFWNLMTSRHFLFGTVFSLFLALLVLPAVAKADSYLYNFNYVGIFGNADIQFTEPSIAASGDVTTFLVATNQAGGTITEFQWNSAPSGICLDGYTAAGDACAAFASAGNGIASSGDYFPANSFLSPGTYTALFGSTLTISKVATPEAGSLTLVCAGILGLGLLAGMRR